MSIGVDALLLVALCGMASWLVQRRRRSTSQRPLQALLPTTDDDIWTLQAGAVLSQAQQPGQPARDWLVIEVLEPSRGSSIALLGLLDGGGQDDRALLVVLANQKALPEDQRQVWLLRRLSAPVSPDGGMKDPPRQREHEQATYQQSTDWRGLLRSRNSQRPVEPKDGRVVLYVGAGSQRLAWLQHEADPAFYAGHELALRDLEIFPT